MNGTDLIRRGDVEAAIIADSVGRYCPPEPVDPYSWALSFVRDVPAVDAVEVRHGRWVHVKTHEMNDEYGGLVGEAYCSECELYSSQLSSYGRVGYDYCPRCGARMDGRREDGDA